MENNKTLNKIEVFPYRELDLLTKSAFISYCSLRGVNVTPDELSMYIKVGLLSPPSVKDKVQSYSIYQIYPLKIIQDKLRYSLSATAIDFKEEDWLIVKNQIKKNYFKNIVALKHECVNVTKELSLYIDLISIAIDVIDKAETIYRNSVKEELNRVENYRDLNSSLKYGDKDAKNKITSLLSSKNLSIEDLIDLQRKFVDIGSDIDPTKKIHAHIDSLNFSDKEKCTGLLRFALDCYAIADNIGVAIQLLGHKSESVIKLLMDKEYFKICPFCSESFIPKRDNQYTCGDVRCKQLQKNSTKKLKYHSIKK